MNRSYSNPWIPEQALTVLSQHRGTLLDVGGGAAPYCRATHIIDAMPFSAERLAANAWGQGCGERAGNVEDPQLSTFSPQIPESHYTQLDLCECREWPFGDDTFDLGLSSHCLEDLRDPLPAVRELSRVCREVLVITPSRLFEQTRGVDHPRYCGFPHHPWIVTSKGNTLVFRRKTPLVMLPACHIVCPLGKTLKLEYGAFCHHGRNLSVEEDPVVWQKDYEDYCEFVKPFRGRRDLFVHDEYRHTPKYWIWKFREWVLGQP